MGKQRNSKRTRKRERKGNYGEKPLCDNCGKRHFGTCRSSTKGGKGKDNFGFNKKEVAHLKSMLAKKDRRSTTSSNESDRDSEGKPE